MNKRLSFAVVALAVLIPIFLPGLRRPSVAHAAPAAAMSAAEAGKIATDAYVFGYPLVTVHMTELVSTNVAHPVGTKAPLNQIANLKQYPTAAFRDITAPNADTLYSSAFIDLSKEPMVFSHPDMGDRYFLFPFLDAYTNVVEVPGKRTTGGKAASYVLTGPGWQGTVPPNMKQIKIPTNTVWLLGRTYCTGTPSDYKAVHELQAKYTLHPLSAGGSGYQPAPGKVDPSLDMKTAVRDQVNALKGSDYFTLLAKLMKENRPRPQTPPWWRRWPQLGSCRDNRWTARRLLQPPSTRRPRRGRTPSRRSRRRRKRRWSTGGWSCATLALTARTTWRAQW